MVGMMATPKPQSNRDESTDLLFKRDPGTTPSHAEAGNAVPWATLRSKEELLAALRPLPGSGSPDHDSPAESLAHNPAPASDRRGAFVEGGSSGKSRINRSGHKP